MTSLQANVRRTELRVLPTSRNIGTVSSGADAVPGEKTTDKLSEN